MRLTRAYIAGLGTTGSLLAAAACAIVFIGAVATFRGSLPTPSIGPTSGSISVAAPSIGFDRVGAAVTSARAALAVGGAPVAIAHARGPALGAPPTSSPTPSGGRPTTLPDFRRTGPGIVVESPSRVPSSTGVAPAPAPVASTATADPGQLAGTVERTASGLGSIVQGSTANLGQGLAQVSPPIGVTVAGAGQTVGGTIDALGHTVGGVVRSLNSG